MLVLQARVGACIDAYDVIRIDGMQGIHDIDGIHGIHGMISSRVGLAPTSIP